MSDTPDMSGSSKGEAWHTPNIAVSRGTESWHTHNVSGERGTEVLERQCEDTDPRKTIAEGSRHTSDTSQQPSAYGDQISIMREMFEMLKEMENKITTVSGTLQTLLHHLNSYNRAFPGRVIQIQHQEKEENEMLKETIKKLEARIQELLAKAMAMHQHSEDINDRSRLSAVLERYEMLRLREWEKVRSSNPCCWTYEEGSHIIKKLFDACEKDIQQRTDEMLKVLDTPLCNNALTKVMMPEIMKLFRQLYDQNFPTVYNKIVQEAAIHTRTENETQFLLQCCEIYCLLLLQDPPVKAEWKMNKSYVEHVDKKDAVRWKKPSLLWPIMKRGKEIIVKGVVWDQRRMT